MSRAAMGKGALALVAGGLAVAVAALAVGASPLPVWIARAATAPAPASALDRTITVRFDTAAAAGMPWHFKPLQREMALRVGETGLVFFEAYNPTDRAIAGSASYAVSPAAADAYLVRVACFCASQRVLQPHERVEIPMTFYIDPAIASDVTAKAVDSISLSYTFHETELPAEEANAAPRSANNPTN